jgi:hypothetical protein
MRTVRKNRRASPLSPITSRNRPVHYPSASGLACGTDVSSLQLGRDFEVASLCFWLRGPLHPSFTISVGNSAC